MTSVGILITMSLGSQTFCPNSVPHHHLHGYSLILFCFSQGGRDEGNYLDDALMRQDAQVSRTEISFFSFASKTCLSWWIPSYISVYIAWLGYIIKKKKKRFP